MEFIEQMDAIRQKSAPVPPPRKYVSMFRIDGVPIMPPLMTTEKRKQMQKIKEKTLKLERKFAEQRCKKLQFRDELEEVLGETQKQMSICKDEETDQANTSRSNISQDSSEIEISSSTYQQDEGNNSYLLLSSLMQKNDDANKSAAFDTKNVGYDVGYELEAQPSEMHLQTERMQKLQKSETLIYDNWANTIIIPLPEVEEQQRQQQQHLLQKNVPQQQIYKESLGMPYQQRQALRDLEEQANLNYLNPQEPKHFALEQLCRQIPAICIDPPTPTPLAGTRTFCEALSATESVESIDAIVLAETKLQPRYAQEFSSFEESSNCSQSSHSGPAHAHDLHAHKKLTNITNKILKYEQLEAKTAGSKQNAVQMQPPQRSATNPSIKLVSTNRSPRSCLSVADNTSPIEHSLVRSNSFTLESPSQALLEHIRQQKAATPNRLINSVKMNSPSALQRDTVESKAKRVQKVELKPRATPTNMRTTKAASSHATSATSPYAHSNSGSIIKTKRSPYDYKSAASSSKIKLTRQLKKCPSTSSTAAAAGAVTFRQVKTRPSMPSLQSKPNSQPLTESAKNRQQAPAADFETEHCQKFMQLIAQQQEEQQRLQLAFEAQQQHLLQQLNAEMCAKSVNSGSQFHIDGISLESSPNPKSDCSSEQSKTSRKSPTLSICSSSVLSSSIAVNDLNSLDVSSCSTLTATTTTSRCTPRRRLFSNEHSPTGAATAVAVIGDNANNSSTTPSASRRRQQHLENERRMAAATKINACARGFLVRRLFQTEQIQRIVQTIRDTLIFVLNLHMETAENPAEANTAANIKLKARLLQQLSSASRTLHLVFFQTTLRERMEIIARDRKRIKTKLLSLNLKRSPRIVR